MIAILVGCSTPSKPSAQSAAVVVPVPMAATTPAPVVIPATMPTTAPIRFHAKNLPTSRPAKRVATSRPITRNSTSRPAGPYLLFNDKSMQAIKAGTKTASVRKGVRHLPATLPAVCNNGDRVLLIDVKSIQKKLSELNADDAAADGSASVEAMVTALNKVYPGIGPGDIVSVITFQTATAATQRAN